MPNTTKNPKVNEDGEKLVWSIHDNAYITEGYWKYVTGQEG
jgi:hypothetical protein